ncbi:MAG: hypothetical protein WCF90_08380 [Methanomicrobiales archaeon]
MKLSFGIAIVSISVCFAAPPSSSSRTISAFETSMLYKKLGRAQKSSWALKTGGTNNSYLFVDPENGDSQPSLGMELPTVGSQVVSASISWSPFDSKVKMTPKKEEHIRLLLQYWGTPELAAQVISYVRSNFRTRRPNSVGASSKVRIGSISVQCGETGGDVTLIVS